MEGESTFVETNGIRLHVMQYGNPEGELAILLHGFPDFWYTWRFQIPVLVNAGFRLLVPDQRGYNLSDKPRGVPNYHIQELCKDIVGLIDYAGKPQATIIAHDWGGAVAFSLGTWYPERVKKLVVVNAPHLMVLMKLLLTNSEQFWKSFYIFQFQVPLLSEIDFLSNKCQNLIGLLQALAVRGDECYVNDEDIEKYVANWRQPRSIPCILGWYRSAIRSFFLRPYEKPSNSVPTLLFWGKEDPAFTLELGLETASICTDVKFELIEDGGHWLHWTHANEVNAKIAAFIR
mmetsp:Transcript_28722/g.51109  ORF Transcript_28722/g.51109 Transcript_28722/m.51109 type:complete len:289 (-) Transcript_28722:26-892(-)